MTEIGVRELKTHASEILRSVRETRTRYTVTYRGRPVGMLVPLPVPAEPDQDGDEVWAELERLGKEMSHKWNSPLSSTELISQMRR
jgi:prevent-host-death family protein